MKEKRKNSIEERRTLITTIAYKDGIIAYDAKQAVEMASRRDIYTGGTIRTFKI